MKNVRYSLVLFWCFSNYDVAFEIIVEFKIIIIDF
jgi:hypothetical protein